MDPDKAVQDFDIVLSDVSEELVSTKVAAALGVVHLADAADEGKTSIINGVVFGRYWRSFVPLTMTFRHKSKTVIFLVDTSSPCSYVSASVLRAFGVEVPGESGITARLNGTSTSLGVSRAHFEDICLLGTDFLSVNYCRLTHMYKELNATITIEVGAALQLADDEAEAKAASKK